MVKHETKIFCVFGILSLLLCETGQTAQVSCGSNVESIDVCGNKHVTGNIFYVYHMVVQSFASKMACSCTVSLKTDDSLSVRLSKAPDTSSCGASIYITINGTANVFNCYPAIRPTFITTHMLRIDANTDAETTFSSPFCIHLEAYNKANMSVSCGSSLTTTSTSTPSVSTTSIPETISTQLYQNQSIISAISTIPVLIISNATTDNAPENTSRTGKGDSTANRNEPSTKNNEFPISIVIPAIIGGIILVLVVVVIVWCVRKRKFAEFKSDSNKLGKRGEDLHQHDNKDMKNDDGDEMRVNVLYESYDDAPNTNQKQHVFDDIGSGYSEIGRIASSRHPDANRLDGGYGYSEVEIPSNKTLIQNKEDISGTTDAVNLSLHKNDESANDVIGHTNGKESTSDRRLDFPVYSMPNKVSKLKSNNEHHTDPFPVYALPDKKKKQDDQKQNSSEGKTKPIIKPKPTPKPEHLQPNQDCSDTANGEGLKYSDLQFQEENSTNNKHFMPMEKTDYAEIL